MINRNIDIIIKENTEEAFSTVGIRFETENGFVGDYEKFDSPELTNDQIIGAVQRLMESLLPMFPKEHEENFKPHEKGIVFKRTKDGKFVLA